MSEYAKRDHAALGAHYVRHISAMTAEALHTKSAIAGELAWRDAEIERLRRERGELARQNAELAARLAEIERAEPVAWIEHELQGTGLRHLHFARRPNTLRDDVVAPIWTELIARPAPADGCGACGDYCR